MLAQWQADFVVALANLERLKKDKARIDVARIDAKKLVAILSTQEREVAKRKRLAAEEAMLQQLIYAENHVNLMRSKKPIHRHLGQGRA